MVGTQRSRVLWVHRGAGYGGYTEEQGMVGAQRSRVWWVHRFMQPWTSIIIRHTSISYHTMYHADSIYSYDALTSSQALISAPLSSRATTVAVWPFIDER